MRLGVCYYPEHWPPERWPLDARLMRAGGLSIVRIGEFAWQLMEPAEGQFNWTWLDTAIETLTAEGLQVVLGTPTATPPAWLCRADPSVLPVDAQGRRRAFGSRRHYCATSAAYRRHTARIVHALATRYGQHPVIIGWQIDNEFGCHDTARCYCPECAAAFRGWLARRYGSLAALNAAWGNVFWSQAYSQWAEIDPPHLTVTEPNPSHVLDYYRFSSDTVVAYQQLQIATLRPHLAAHQKITTNFMGNFPDLDYHAVARDLDWVTWDSYPTGYAEVQAQTLYLPTEARPAWAYDVGDPYVTGFCHDLTRGLKAQVPFWVMEQQCGAVNWSTYNTGVRSGTPRLWTWHALAAGAEAVVYFRWRACRFAQEQHHSGLLHHDVSAAVGYEDVLHLQQEQAALTQLAAEPLRNPVALLLDYADLWALQLQPHRQDFGYLRHLFVFYRALQQLGVPVDVVPPDRDLRPYRLVLAPTLFLVSDVLAAHLTQYVAQGGQLLLGVRSGFKTPTNIVTDQPLPGLLRELVGATVAQWHALPPQVGYAFESQVPALVGPATFWAEALQTHSAQPLATYTAGPFTGKTALTANAVGQGCAYYLGFYPTLAQAQALVAHVTQAAQVSPLVSLPMGLVAAQRGPYTLLLNFMDEALTATFPTGQAVEVPARDVRWFKTI